MIMRVFSGKADGFIVYGGVFAFQADVLGHPAAAAQRIGYNPRNALIPFQFDFFGLMMSGFILDGSTGFISD